MGIDKGNVRCIIHYGVSKSIEAYYQETGRAGRDGLESRCELFWNEQDLRNTARRIGYDKDDKPMMYIRNLQKFEHVQKFIYSKDCRIKFIMNYFDECDFFACIERCDNCLKDIGHSLLKNNGNEHGMIMNTSPWIPDKDKINAKQAVKIKNIGSNNNNSPQKREKIAINKFNKKRSFNEMSNNNNNNLNHNRDLMSKRRKVSSEDNKTSHHQTTIDQDINSKIIVLPKKTNYAEMDAFDIKLPQITIESKEIYQSFASGQSIRNIAIQKNINNTMIERALSDMIINGYKIDWKRLPFDIRIIQTVFDALATNGIGAGYDEIRQHDISQLGQYTDSQIDLLIARYIAENLNGPNPENHRKKWTLRDDDKLWKIRDECIIEIAQRFQRTATSIMARLQILRNPAQKPHKRLMEFYGQKFAKCKVECNGFHILSVNDDNVELAEDKEWSVEEDLCLWHNRDQCLNLLIHHFNVKPPVIITRLMDLSGIDWNARSRMNKYLSK